MTDATASLSNSLHDLSMSTFSQQEESTQMEFDNEFEFDSSHDLPPISIFIEYDVDIDYILMTINDILTEYPNAHINLQRGV